MKVCAPAKINLILEITGKRSDGYHELRTLMQTVTLADGIVVEKNNAHRLRFRCTGRDSGPDDSNIALIAATMFFRRLRTSPSVDIVLSKEIPVSAGLGGGSSDAAAVLTGLNELHGAPFSKEELLEMATELGSDVPFFLVGGTALAEGRGERVTPLPSLSKVLILLINPGFAVPTARVYSCVNLDLTTPRRLHNILPALSKGNLSAEKLSAAVHNDLQPVVLSLFPHIGNLLRWLEDSGAGCAAVSGSGGTVFGLFLDPDVAERAALAAMERFPWSCLVETAG